MMGAQVGFKKIFVSVPVAGTAVKVSDERIFCSSFEIFVPDGNTGSIYIGDESVENASGANGGWIPRAKASSADNPNGIHSFIASGDFSRGEGDFFDLSKIYVNADTANDGVIIVYIGAQK